MPKFTVTRRPWAGGTAEAEDFTAHAEGKAGQGAAPTSGR